jgi:para-nitrobenzyl esterase
MNSYWANFAATGDPNGKGLPIFTTKHMKVIQFRDRVDVTDFPAAEEFAFFTTYGYQDL